MAKIKELIEKLKVENLALQREVIAEEPVHARALLDNVRLQRDMRRVVKKKEENAWSLTA